MVRSPKDSLYSLWITKNQQKLFMPKPEFRFYAIADELKNILYGREWQTGRSSSTDPPTLPMLPFGS